MSDGSPLALALVAAGGTSDLVSATAVAGAGVVTGQLEASCKCGGRSFSLTLKLTLDNSIIESIHFFVSKIIRDRIQSKTSPYLVLKS